MEKVMLNEMPAKDLLYLYEDSCELGYDEMKALIVLEVKRRSGEEISKDEWETAMQLVKDSGGTDHQSSRESDNKGETA